ncbi:uncharacterized protein LOC123518526 [Portunus trituberculatus]|uniref:uncharacterized protein LOC123518526 n=1 Tax=Portunus trituberculatus TaxID=210409 RepID=UPI001E1D1B7B|nr:uncharacterized protein LOC123518526 [Portunus trituberculatus]
MKMVTRIAASALVVVMVVAMIGPAAATPSPKAEAAAAAAAAAEPCCGRGAAGALGFVGGFVIGRAVGHRHHHHHHGCGGCGGGWCGGCGRRRRSLDEVMGTGKLEEVYRLITSKDKDQCGLRLVCELAQKNQRDLTDSEVTVLLPYWGLEESDEKSYYGRYDKAVWHGQQGTPCKELFPRCMYSANQIMTDFLPDSTGLYF